MSCDCQLRAIIDLFCCKEQSMWASQSPKTIDLDIAVQGDSVSCNCTQKLVHGNTVSCNCNENGVDRLKRRMLRRLKSGEIGFINI